MSTFFAAFPDSVHGREMVQDLLGDGVELDDISLIVHGNGKTATGSVGDATSFVWSDEDPSHDPADERRQAADYVITGGSPIGGGESTADSATNVESVDQMEDSQEAAELESWPPDDPEVARDDLDDLDHSMMKVEAVAESPEDRAYAENTEEDRLLEAIRLDGVGEVYGGGDLATAALSWAGRKNSLDASEFLTYLQDEGVPPENANALLEEFENGGALLAVALTPEVDDQALEAKAERHGAVTTGWFGAPRY